MDNKKFFKISLITMIVIVVFIGNLTAYNFAGVITQYLCGFGLDFNSESAQKAREEGNALVKEIDKEGFVLLKNKDNALPLTAENEEKPKVNVFGWSGSKQGFYYRGYGSAGGYKNSEIPLYEGLEQGGLSVNPALKEAYDAIKLKNGRYPNYTTDPQARYQVYEPGKAFLDEHLSQAKSYSETAIVVISRIGSEGTDLPKWQYSADDWSKLSNGKTYLQLSPDEEELVDFCKENFEKCIILLNTSNVMECGFIEDDKIDAALWIGLPGNAGSPAIAEVLTGKANPSGKLVDTYAYDLRSDPTYVNAGMDGIGSYSRTVNTHYVDYAENIYTGYYWYETADAEGYWNDVDNAYGKGYDGIVQYSFGFGLSYTEFSWTVLSSSLPSGNDGKEKITLDVYVENVGGVAGKDVVELYASAPYYLGGIEKPSVKLCAFAKTAELKPGEGQKLTLEVNLSDLSSYDCYDANNNGFMGYELEGGKYTLSLRTDSHNLKAMDGGELSFTVKSEGIKYAEDPVTGYTVENRFTNYVNEVSGASSVADESKVTSAKALSVDGLDSEQNVIYMTRADFVGTFPVHSDERAMSNALMANAATFPSPLKNADDPAPVLGSTETSYTLLDVAGLSYDDEKWYKLINQLDLKTIAELSANGGYNTNAIDSIGKPVCVDLDGGSGIYPNVTGKDIGDAVTYPCTTVICATWNWYLAYSVGQSLAKEAREIKMNGWYAPGANLHRSPFGGRNFEYFSEDPYISGIMCAYEVKGSINGGVYAYVKHFVANDSDQGRNGEYRWLTEQALRENYMKPFELSVKVGGANGMMSSVDRVGATRAACSYQLLTEVLRNEWGFKGSVITDYYQGGNTHDADQHIRAGNDLQLLPGGTASLFDDTSSNTAILALQKSAHNILYTYINTQYLHANEQSLSLNEVIGTRTSVFPWWIPVLVGVDVLVAAGLGVWAFFILKKDKKEITK